MYYPIYRPRRLRRTEGFRRMIRETILHIEELIYPIFVTYGRDKREEISAMPGCYRFSIDNITKEVREAAELGIPAIILFGIPDKKDEIGSEAYNPKGVVQEAIRAIKTEIPKIVVITDVCIDEYTSHGHCGVVRDGEIDNDATLELLAQMALSHAQAGADIVAPSDMMDGRVKAIRKVLDEHGFQHTPIMSYAAKYASSFYGPFREAADSIPKFGDRKSYQMDIANSREAMREIRLDIEEGADIIMVKPALPYLDIIWQARQKFDLPIAAYNVSGEYAMIKAAASQGWLDEERVILESLTCIKRAGADLILTYFAKDVARLLRK
ncbi:MAG: delta-aminolevulinic acid dehydratase [Nitrospinae bacterium RIFCSPLOWO2_12_FULL_45_22]|nr:MAG: delta-aminolevulinic acid dehydratase [Nitrospinae bacterium RIFCSPLOWO2_12_FULL_45_22]